MPLVVTPRISIPEEEIEFTFVRASGAGGQNVQKVSSAVQLRMDVARSPSLPEAVKRRLATLAGRRMTAEGILVIMAQQHRTVSQRCAVTPAWRHMLRSPVKTCFPKGTSLSSISAR